MAFTVKKKGSEKGVSRSCLEQVMTRPLHYINRFVLRLPLYP